MIPPKWDLQADRQLLARREILSLGRAEFLAVAQVHFDTNVGQRRLGVVLHRTDERVAGGIKGEQQVGAPARLVVGRVEGEFIAALLAFAVVTTAPLGGLVITADPAGDTVNVYETSSGVFVDSLTTGSGSTQVPPSRPSATSSPSR